MLPALRNQKISCKAYRVTRSLPGWLSCHATCMRSLHVNWGCDEDWQLHLRLPLQQLSQLHRLHLEFNGSTTYTNSSSSSSNDPPAGLAGSLTALELRYCTLQGADGTLAAATVLTGLRRLQLVGVAVQHAAAPVQTDTVFRHAQPAQASSLEQMTHLTHVSLGDTESSCLNSSRVWHRRTATTSAAVQAINRLVALQQLELAVDYCTGVPALSASLQLLHIHSQPDCDFGSPLGSNLQLTGLQQLDLRGIGGLELEALSSMRELRRLVIDLPGVDFIEDTLPVLAGFTQLQHQYLNCKIQRQPICKKWTGKMIPESDEPEMDEQAFAALTASTQLTQLAVRGHLPLCAGRYMFPDGHQLPQLHSVNCCIHS